MIRAKPGAYHFLVSWKYEYTSWVNDLRCGSLMEETDLRLFFLEVGKRRDRRPVLDHGPACPELCLTVVPNPNLVFSESYNALKGASCLSASVGH